jgi:hypothetical protein
VYERPCDQMRRLHFVRALTPLLALGACGEHERAAQGAVRAGPRAAATAQDTTAPFQGTVSAVHRPPPPGLRASASILRTVHTAAQVGYDRIVFELSGDSPPGYHVEYSDRPARKCGSGDVVPVSGAARLLVRLERVQAHDERGNPTIVERERAPALPVLKEMKLICDFEGQVEWVLGVAARNGYRVLELTEPPRLVVDLRHRE